MKHLLTLSVFYEQKLIDIFNIILEKHHHSPNSLGLLGGKTGLSMALLLYAVHSKDSKCRKEGIKILETAFETIEQSDSYVFSFCNGLAGFGWALEYLEQKGYHECDTNVLLEDFDSVLSDVLALEMKNGNYDFLHGALGMVYYFISRIQKNGALLPVLQKFIVQLHALSEKHSTGSIKWDSIINREKDGRKYNISLSHGMSSIAVILSKLYAIKGMDKEMIKSLLQGCVNYILEQEIDKDKYGSFFPIFAIESMEQLHGSRLAWCYGDLGIAMALWQAGIALQNETWKNKALEVLLFAAEKRRDLEASMIIEAPLCHGTVGVGHIFYRMWRNTRLPEFKNAADYWMNETLKMAKFEDGLAGYKAWYGDQGWLNDYSLLEGIAGVGLALMTYYYEVEPTWDECLLLS
ncbi:MAG: lanthionine synthetase C family protein [Bacteroidales bacterium]|nr:lanthionine synthetase C family protein [Bacteroidales bacterium]